jgi:hypothetical protein
MLRRYDRCDICLFVFRSCQINFQDSLFQNLLASNAHLSVVRSDFWKDSILDQLRDAQDNSLRNGQNNFIQSNKFEIPPVIGIEPIDNW